MARSIFAATGYDFAIVQAFSMIPFGRCFAFTALTNKPPFRRSMAPSWARPRRSCASLGILCRWLSARRHKSDELTFGLMQWIGSPAPGFFPKRCAAILLGRWLRLARD